MKKVTAYEFNEKEIELIKTYLYKAPANPCKNCDQDCKAYGYSQLSMCEERNNWNQNYDLPFRNIFDTDTIDILSALLEYRDYLDKLNELELKLEQHRKRRYEFLTKLPSSVVEAIEEIPQSRFSGCCEVQKIYVPVDIGGF